MTRPPSLLEYHATHKDESTCWNQLRQARWGNGFRCPRCAGTENWGFVKTRRLFQCHACNYQASVTAGTILQDTKLPLTTWFLAAYLICTTKKGISTLELARKLGVSDKTAWYLNHKILHVLGKAQASQLFGLVEADEAFVSGKRKKKAGRSGGRQLVLGLVERAPRGMGRVRLVHVPDASRPALHDGIREHVQPGSTVRTDGWAPYRGLAEYRHEAVPDWAVEGPGRQLPGVHLVFSNLKRVLKGVYTGASDDKLQSFLNGFVFRFDHRNDLGQGVELALGLLIETPPVTYQQIRTGGLN